MTKQQPDVGNLGVFEQLRGIINELRNKVEARFEIVPNPAIQELQNFSDPTGEVQGTLNTFSGREIDWLVYQCARRAQVDFTYVRLVIWLSSENHVPHLVFELGGGEQMLLYMDYIPRTDLFYDLQYLDRYYEPANQTYLNFLADSRFQAFNSKSPYIRQVGSPTCLCFTCPTSNEIISLLSNVAHEMMDRWLIWVDEAEPVPESERAALFERDLIVRRAIAERDPGNENSVRLLGAELTDKITRSLWGGNRIL